MKPMPTLTRSLAALFLCTFLHAESYLDAVKEQVRRPEFAKEFAGSYGILSDVEPEVSDAEQLLLTRLQTLFTESKFKDAENLLVAFIKETEKPTDPEKAPAEISPAMIFVLGNLYFQAERYDEAKRAFEAAIKRFPRFRRAFTNLGYVHLAQNKLDEALKSFQKSVNLGESSSRVMGMLGYCYLTKQNPLAAENAYRQAYLTDPDARDWKMGLAQSLLAQDKNEEAASLFGVLIQENQQDKQLWMRQTGAYLAMDRKDEAILNLETLRLMGLTDEANLTLLGNLYMDQAQPKLALSAYSDALSMAKSVNVPQSLKAARILNDYGFPDEAAELINKIRGATKDIVPADRIAMELTDVKIARAQNNLDRVGTILKQLLADAPANGEVLLETAKHFDQLARDQEDEQERAKLNNEAKTHYLLAVENEITAYAANLGYGQMLVRDGRTIDALPYLEKSLSLKKSDSLEQYVSRVRRAADREKVRKEREEAERAEQAEANKK
jgi:tetratricopeptide (TPR) repeat protein